MSPEESQLALRTLVQAIDFAGSQSGLARLIGPPVTQAHISNWLNRNGRISVNYVMKASKITGLKPWNFRPDIFSSDDFTGL